MPASVTAVKTLLLTDLVDSTRLIDELGDSRAAELLSSTDRIARDLLTRFGGTEIDKSDGFLFLFDRPVAAVRFALAYHAALADAAEGLGRSLAARVGIHLGEVVLRQNPPDDIARGAKPIEVEGLAKHTVARVASLAAARQTLLTQSAFDLARRAMADEANAPRALRWLVHGRYTFAGVDEALDIFEIGVEGSAPLAAPADTAKARRVRGRRSRMTTVEGKAGVKKSPNAGYQRPLGGIVPSPGSARGAAARQNSRAAPILLGLLAIVLAAVTVRMADWAAPPSSDTGALFIAPFEYTGDPEYEYLGRGIAKLLETSLVSVVDPPLAATTVIDAQRPDRVWSSADAIEYARETGATRIVVGTVAVAGDQVQIRARVHEATRDSLVRSVQVEGAAAAIFEVVDELSRRLLPALADDVGRDAFTELALLTTESLPALRSFLDGEAAMDEGRYFPAMNSFRSAVAYDSTFALAHFRLSMAANWVAENQRAVDAAEAARRFADRLPPDTELLLEAWEHYLYGRYLQSEALLRRFLTRNPNHADALYVLGEVLFHYAPSQGRSAEGSRAIFERLPQGDHNYLSAQIHLAHLAATRDDGADFRRIRDRIRTHGPDSPVRSPLDALEAFTFGSPDDRERMLTELRLLDGPTLQNLTGRLIAATEAPRRLEPVARLLCHPSRAPMFRARGHITLAHLLMAQGRLDAARDEIDAAARLPDSAYNQTYLGVFLALPYVPADESEIQEAIALVRSAGAGETVQLPDEEAPRPAVSDRRRYFILGLLESRIEGPSAARRRAAQLLALNSSDPLERERELLAARLLEALAIRESDGPARALASLGPPDVQADGSLSALSRIYGAYERYLRSALLLESGRLEEARQWLESFLDPSGFDLLYLPLVYRMRAELYMDRGELEAARAEYAALVDLWRDADPRFQEQLAQIAAELAALGGGAEPRQTEFER